MSIDSLMDQGGCHLAEDNLKVVFLNKNMKFTSFYQIVDGVLLLSN